MRRSTAYNQRPDRQRLSFATCRKCGKTFAVLGVEGQHIRDVLHDNGFFHELDTDLEMRMECVCCWSWLPVQPPSEEMYKTYEEWREMINKLMYGEVRY